MFINNSGTHENIQYYDDGQIKSKIYLNDKGQKQGETIHYHTNGSISEKLQYMNGTLWGEQFTYFQSGNKKEYYRCLNNDKEGIYTSYYDNDKNTIKEQLHYKDGEQSGKQECYFSNTKLQEFRNFVSGSPFGEQKFFWENGNEKLVYSVGPDGNPEGVLRRFFEDGEIEVSSEFSNGKRNGALKEYYPGGALKKELNYKNDVLDGEQKSFDQNGNILVKSIYDNGNKVS